MGNAKTPFPVPPGVKLGEHKFKIEWEEPEERISRRTGETYIWNVRHDYTHRYRKNVEKKKAQLEADGYKVSEIYDCWAMSI